MNEKIELSVCVVCYNQEKYIAECLESLVSQETNFKFEIIVGEDCSTDNTRIIVQQYVDRYPHLIRPIFYRKNVGAVENIKQVYIAAKGKYIAHIDGDDLAFPAKLQKQFDILESNIDCNICTHDVKKIGVNGKFSKRNVGHNEGKYDLVYLYQNLPFFAHSSKVFRNKYSPDFWDELLNDPKILDLDIHIASLENSYIYHINEYLGVYRVGVGISFKNTKVNRDLSLGAERVYEKGLKMFQGDRLKTEVIKEAYAAAMLQCAYSYAVNDKDIKMFNLYLNKSIEQKNMGLKQNIFKLAKILPSVFFPIFSMRSKIKNL